MKTFGIPTKIINLVQEMYREFSCRVEINGRLTDTFSMRPGVRQGCLLSPILFLMVLDIIKRKTISKGKRGIYWNFSEILDLDFADDLCLLSQSFRDMNQKVKDLIKIAKGAGPKNLK
jgi:hypothetical protein